MSLEREERLASEIKDLLGSRAVEIKIQRIRSIFVTVKKEDYKESIRKVVDRFAITHLSTITGADSGQTIDVMPHFSYAGTKITFKSSVPKTAAEIDTLTDIIPGAVMYEREIHDLLGVGFKGHPTPERFILPDDWPSDVYPLRKEYKVARPEPIPKT